MKLCAIVFEFHQMPIAISAADGAKTRTIPWRIANKTKSASHKECRKAEGRFMEGLSFPLDPLLPLLPSHEPKPPGAPTALSASSGPPALDRADKAVRTPSNRFMGSLHFLDTHWDHELSESPSTALRAPSPPVGEKDGMRGFGSWRGMIVSFENDLNEDRLLLVLRGFRRGGSE
jgi:hypothetical protein